MGLHRRLHTESLERRLCLAIETATPTQYLDVDPDLLSQSVSTAAATGGANVVVYSDRDSVTGKGKDVWLRRYLANGSAIAVPERVNTTLANAQMNVDVAMNSATSYAVVWQSENQDGSGWGVYARVHTSSGWSSEILVNQTTAGAQVDPKIAMTASGGFVVTWTGRDDNGGNGQIYARRFDSTGVAAGNERAVSPGGAFAVSSPDIAATSGAVAITWVSADINNASQTDVAYRQYDANLTAPLASAVTVNTTTAGDQAEPVIAALGGSTTDFVVAFSDTDAGEDALITMRRMNTGGTTYTQQIVSQDSDGNRNRVRIASAGSTTVVGWTQQIAGAPVASSVTRVFDANLNAASNEAAIDDGESARTLHDLAVLGNGRFREVTTLGILPGYGVASADDLANVIVLTGTSAADEVVIYDSGTTVIRAGVNKQVTSYTRSAFDHIRVDLGAGNDNLIANNCSLWATVSGGDGNDTILATSGSDSIGGGNGNDLIICFAGNDYAIGNDGNDFVYGDPGNDTLTGGAGKDSLHGNDGNDRLAGSASPDQLFGESGDDRLYGEAGDDRLDGGGNVDRCYGGDGNDYVGGGSSNDRCFGEAGNDTLIGGKGSDYLDGGLNTDLVLSKEPGDTLISIESS